MTQTFIVNGVDVLQKIKNLEQENKRLFSKVVELAGKDILCKKYEKALEEVRVMATKDLTINTFVNIQNKINEVLNDQFVNR